MRADEDILVASRAIPNKIIEEIEPIAQLIYENIFQRDPRYCDWQSAKYKAPEQPEGFAQSVCWVVANDIRELKNETD